MSDKTNGNTDDSLLTGEIAGFGQRTIDRGFNAAKAIMQIVGPILTALLIEVAEDLSTTISVLIAGVVGFIIVYATPNRPIPTDHHPARRDGMTLRGD